MSDQTNDSIHYPGYTCTVTEYKDGITLLDYFAKGAMESLLINGEWSIKDVQRNPEVIADLAKSSYIIGLAMVNESEKSKKL